MGATLLCILYGDGTGKSKVLIDNISMLYDNGKINGVLIVAPKGVEKTGTKVRYLHTCKTYRT